MLITFPFISFKSSSTELIIFNIGAWHNHLFVYLHLSLRYLDINAHLSFYLLYIIYYYFNIQNVVPLGILNSLTVTNSILSILSILDVEN